MSSRRNEGDRSNVDSAYLDAAARVTVEHKQRSHDAPAIAKIVGSIGKVADSHQPAPDTAQRRLRDLQIRDASGAFHGYATVFVDSGQV